MAKPLAYKLQNRAVHEARRQLEEKGILDPWAGVDQIREMAGELNLGIRSISKLSLKQREILIEKLIEMGARVRNPHIYGSDLLDEGGRKIVLFSEPKESQIRMIDTLANQVHWRSPDGYLRLCYKLLKAPRPHNSREITRLRLAL